ncbi:MAG: putative toxin-antitoxin system toxin component, PIN family [Saprospiraceae bacterium]
MKSFIINDQIKIVLSPQLLSELKSVTNRDKIKKYFPREKVLEIVEYLETISEVFDIKPTHFNSRDFKDNFLLDLIDISNANYLVTGDKDLLSLNPFKSAIILRPADFEKVMRK